MPLPQSKPNKCAWRISSILFVSESILSIADWIPIRACKSPAKRAGRSWVKTPIACITVRFHHPHPTTHQESPENQPPFSPCTPPAAAFAMPCCGELTCGISMCLGPPWGAWGAWSTWGPWLRGKAMGAPCCLPGAWTPGGQMPVGKEAGKGAAAGQGGTMPLAKA